MNFNETKKSYANSVASGTQIPVLDLHRPLLGGLKPSTAKGKPKAVAQKSLQNPANTEYLQSATPLRFIRLGEPMPGTSGLFMKKTRTVFANVKMPPHQLNNSMIENKKVVLDYGGLVHFSKNPQRVEIITSATDKQKQTSIEAWITGILKKLEKPSQNASLYVKYAQADSRGGYHVTLLKPNALKSNPNDFNEIIADKLILKDYGEVENTLHVQTGFPVNRRQVLFDEHRLTHVFGRSYSQQLELQQKPISLNQLMSDATLPEIKQPKVQQTATKKTETSNNLPNPSEKKKQEANTTKPDTKITPIDQAKLNILNQVEALEDKVEMSHRVISEFMELSYTKEQAEILKKNNLPNKNLLEQSIALTKQKYPVLKYDAGQQEKNVSALALLIISSAGFKALKTVMSHFKLIQADLFLLENSLQELAAHKITFSADLKQELQSMYDSAFEDYASQHEGLNTLLAPIFIGLSQNISLRTALMEKDSKVYIALENNDSITSNRISQTITRAMEVAHLGIELADENKTGTIDDNIKISERLFEKTKMNGEDIRVFIDETKIYSARWLSKNPQIAQKYINALQQFAKMLDTEIEYIDFMKVNLNFIHKTTKLLTAGEPMRDTDVEALFTRLIKIQNLLLKNSLVKRNDVQNIIRRMLAIQSSLKEFKGHKSPINARALSVSLHAIESLKECENQLHEILRQHLSKIKK